MVRRFIKDESGIAMGLTVIMIVLIGVMGAGLLAFVRNDLEAVVEVNQGQKALEMADSGVEAARKHLRTIDARPKNYDSDPNNNPNEDHAGWSELEGGKTLSFDGNEIEVEIRYLIPSTNEDEASRPERAPEVLPNGDACEDPENLDSNDEDCTYPNNANFFRVTARGEAGDALRKVRAIYRTQNFDIPVAYFATRDIDFNGNSSSVNGVSLFARRNIYNLRAENLSGQDQAYGNWVTDPVTGGDNEYNAVPRATDKAGAAALGSITYKPNVGRRGDRKQKDGDANPQRYGKRDLDGSSDSVPDGKDFQANSWGDPSNQPSGTVTFPFATGNEEADDDLLSQLKQKAISQGNYVRRGNGESFTIDDGSGSEQYPADSALGTVFFVEFADGDLDNPAYGDKGNVTYKPRTDNSDGYNRGTVVVVNGNLSTSSSADDHEGVFVVRDGDDSDDDIMLYDNGGSLNIRGFVNVEGDISLQGNVDGVLPGELTNGIPGVYTLSLWSWRECYSESCG